MSRFQPFLKPALHKELAEYLDGFTIMPVNIEISITGKCNANCPWCFYKGEKTRDSIDSDTLLGFLEEAEMLGVKAITWTGGGEPTMHPNFAEFVEKAFRLGLDQGLITNGWCPTNFNPSLLNWIRVSRSSLGLNMEKLKYLRQCETLGLAINYNGNYKEVNEAVKIGEKIGVDYVQIRPVLNTKGKITEQGFGLNIKPHTLLIMSEYKFEDAKIKHNYKKCEAFHFVPFVWENGDVDVCGYMRNIPGYNLGNIYKESFKDIMKKAHKSVPVCDNCQVCCKNHELNKLINELKQIKDKNFI